MINERKLSKAELNKREDIIMNMKGNKRDLVKKYGKDAEAVMYGRATNMAKKQTENMRDSKLTELIKDALANPKKADLDKDGKLSSYEKTRGAAIEKNLSEGEEVVKYKGEDHVITRRDGDRIYLRRKEDAAVLGRMPEFWVKSQDISEDLESGQYGDPVDAELDVTKSAPDQTGLEAELGLEEDIDIGHEDNEPGMLQGDLYQIGKSAMELYELLDDMEGEGEVDLPSWWQAKIYKAKEAIVGAAEYLEFELKEPAIDAVVDTLAPLEIEVDPLGETVEDYITSVDDMTESQRVASKLAKKLKESISDEDKKHLDMIAYYEFGADSTSGGFDKLGDAEKEEARKFMADKKSVKEGLPKDYWGKKIDAKDENQDGKIDESVTNQDIEDIENSGNIDIAYKKALNMLKKLVKDGNQDGKVNESYATVVNKIEKSGKSEKAAKAIAGAVASYKAKGGGKGPTAKQK